MNNLISLTEYAALIGKEPSVVRKRAEKGFFKTAQKIGRNWVIDKDEFYPIVTEKTFDRIIEKLKGKQLNATSIRTAAREIGFIKPPAIVIGANITETPEGRHAYLIYNGIVKSIKLDENNIIL